MRLSAAKTGAVAVIFAAHVLLICMLALAPQRRSTDGARPMTMVFIEDKPPAPPPVALPRENFLQSLRPFIEPPPPIVSLPTPAQDESSTAITLPDWSSQAHEAAAQTLKQQNSTPQQALDHVYQTSPEKPKTGVFAPEPHRAHTVEYYDDGSERHWVSDHCYFDVERIPSGTADLIPGPRVRVPTCKPPAGAGGADMFEDLKPEALRRLPPPAH